MKTVFLIPFLYSLQHWSVVLWPCTVSLIICFPKYMAFWYKYIGIHTGTTNIYGTLSIGNNNNKNSEDLEFVGTSKIMMKW